jgi:hypothetical protein
MFNGSAVILRGSDFLPTEQNPRVAQGLPLSEGEVYNVLIRNERVASDTDLSDGLDRTYSIRVWGIAQAEPDSWAIQYTMLDQEPFGSFYLNTHFVDATFGDIRVTELPASDVVAGRDSLETLLAAGAPPEPAATAGPGSAPSPAPAVAPLASLVASGDDPALAA